MSRGRRTGWAAALVAVAVLAVARNLSGLASAPLGAYVDETSIGYNAWAISTHAVDEHGAHLPLYFTAFGEYKNPVYIYALSAVLRVLPLTVTTIRLPAAALGLLTCLLITLIAWRRSRSLPITLLALAIAALTPWLTVESRIGFEVIAMVTALAAALLCLSIAQDGGKLGWYAAAGCFLAVAVFAYSTGRVAVALLALALGAAEYRRSQRLLSRWLVTLVPIAAAYIVLEAWNLQHPGALTERFNVISIGADGAPLPTVAGRFIGNYLAYFSPDFLFIHGDHNVRHATQFGGMLLWVTLPLVIAGVVCVWRRRDQTYLRFVALATLIAPVSAALTEESVPHSLRAAVMLPFLLVLAVEGMILLRGVAGTWRTGAALLAGIAVAAQGALYTIDMFATWPARSATGFDTGEIDAIARASALAGRTQLLLSTSLDQPYIQAAFALRPAPPTAFTADSVTPLLAAMNMALVNPATLSSRPGAVVVLAAGDPIPSGAQRILDESSPSAAFSFGQQPPSFVTIVVYRMR